MKNTLKYLFDELIQFLLLFHTPITDDDTLEITTSSNSLLIEEEIF